MFEVTTKILHFLSFSEEERILLYIPAQAMVFRSSQSKGIPRLEDIYPERLSISVPYQLP